MERKSFEFDGGYVRFTVAGQIIANFVMLLFWAAITAAFIATVLLVTFAVISRALEQGIW